MKRLSEKRVAEQLRKLNGNVAAVARAFDVTRTAVYEYCRARPELQAVLQESRESMKDNAESSLYRSVLEGEGWAVCFYLKTQAKDRGYIERQEMEVSGPNGGPVVTEMVIEHHATAEQPTPRGDGQRQTGSEVPSGPDAGVAVNGSLPARSGGHS